LKQSKSAVIRRFGVVGVVNQITVSLLNQRSPIMQGQMSQGVGDSISHPPIVGVMQQDMGPRRKMWNDAQDIPLTCFIAVIRID
jgi:hypothetical protein